jgi:hypothetical protein
VKRLPQQARKDPAERCADALERCATALEGLLEKSERDELREHARRLPEILKRLEAQGGPQPRALLRVVR